MPIRTITVRGRAWRVLPSGFTTANVNDEHGVLFIAGEGDQREVRVSHYSPLGERSRERALAALSDEYLAQLLRESQPSETAPETGYRKSPPGA
ncbi:hypothetical protein tb265_35390 [Gemmatimonadetes bacterium T265]|nr:hypothetical protein tb265_35390 [Gemmatimonadetes bacterium T265]